MVKTYTMDLAGRTLKVEIGKVGKQANGCAFMQYGDTTVLCTATASAKPREGIDFFPLSVEYSEKFYAVGKFPGGYNKREGKPSENAILTSRVIDRPMRPVRVYSEDEVFFGIYTYSAKTQMFNVDKFFFEK